MNERLNHVLGWCKDNRYRLEHKSKDIHNISKRKWRKNNLEKSREFHRNYYNDKRKNDLKYNINDRMKSAIRRSLIGNKGGRHWEDLVGYNMKKLIKRLKLTIPQDCNWQDYLKGRLHIDHIIPISAFNFTKPEHPDFKKCWALSNLQLLPAKENIGKGNKLIRPFQPALRIKISYVK